MLSTWYSFTRLMRITEPFIQDIYREQIKRELISQGAFLIILVTEAILYWRIRNRITRKDFVWMHIGGLLLAFVGIPIVFSVFVAFQSLSNGAGEAQSAIARISNINRYLIWAGIIIGHIGFVLVLINAFKKRSDNSDTATSDGQDILNDYA
ncbi:hypothetical protein [Paraflavitalea speifideaquila]|uniref:hypothetical protein n=1 Tax=Paraflavitalea speifideaquila TaxID=3076558 RepID=UPI0028E9D51C|nr:hypothetical protein [Paraflavitalea speifideiaquila]